jgi:hypothetical protein
MRAATGKRVSLIRVDLPEPETPVMQQKVPTGISASTAFRLLPRGAQDAQLPLRVGACAARDGDAQVAGQIAPGQ